MTYEVHITCDLKDAELATKTAEKHDWKTSQIERDIILGEKSYFYLTKHFRTKEEAFEGLAEASYSLIANYYIKIVRQKIELIIYDTKLQ